MLRNVKNSFIMLWAYGQGNLPEVKFMDHSVDIKVQRGLQDASISINNQLQFDCQKWIIINPRPTTKKISNHQQIV